MRLVRFFVCASLIHFFQCARKCFCLTFHFLLMLCVFFLEMNFFVVVGAELFSSSSLARCELWTTRFVVPHEIMQCLLAHLSEHKRIVNLRHDKNKLVAEMKKISLCFIHCWLIKIFVLLSETFFDVGLRRNIISVRDTGLIKFKSMLNVLKSVEVDVITKVTFGGNL